MYYSKLRTAMYFYLDFYILFVAFLSTCNCTLLRLTGSQSKKVLNLPKINSLAGEYRNVYHCEQTIAIVDFDIKKQVKRCEIMDTNQLKEAVISGVINSLWAKKIEIKFEKMLELIKICDGTDRDTTYDGNILKMFFGTLGTISTSVLYGVYPGTKWCGMGDIAKDYQDLGPKRGSDRCCRAHDLCPVRVEGSSRSFGIENSSPTTISHCKCDRLLHDCLKKDGSLPSHVLLTKFFGLLRPKCIEDLEKRIVKEFSLD